MKLTMQQENMTLGQYSESLKYDLARYGFINCPLTAQEIESCYLLAIDLDTAYLIACDVNAGFTFLESYSINLKQESV